MTMNEHRRPLAPGEIRTHTVGARTFLVMHVAGGSFAQASYRDSDVRTVPAMRVICTDPFADHAVRAYADAIEQAEADAATSLPTVPQDRTADGVPEVEQAGTPAPTLADDVAALRAEFASHPKLYADVLARLDRIAGAVPQRAVDEDLPEIWLDVERQCVTLEINGTKRYRRWWFGKTEGAPAVEWCHGVHSDAIQLYPLGGE